MSVIPTKNLSKYVLTTLIRDKMRTDALDSNIPLTDPKEHTRGDNAPFILTSYPTTNVFYPHIIINEIGYGGQRLDAREDFFGGTMKLAFKIYAETNTHLFQIKDQIRDWLQRHVTYFNRQGFTELQFDSSVDTTWDEMATVKTMEITVSAKPYTTTEE